MTCEIYYGTPDSDTIFTTIFGWLCGLGTSVTPNNLGYCHDPAWITHILQIIGAFSTFFGGIAIAAGFLTPVAALGLAGAMAVALFIHLTVFHSVFVKYPFDAPSPTYEPAIIYLAIAIVFVFTGPEILSVDYLLFGK